MCVYSTNESWEITLLDFDRNFLTNTSFFLLYSRRLIACVLYILVFWGAVVAVIVIVRFSGCTVVCTHLIIIRFETKVAYCGTRKKSLALALFDFIAHSRYERSTKYTHTCIRLTMRNFFHNISVCAAPVDAHVSMTAILPWNLSIYRFCLSYPRVSEG